MAHGGSRIGAGRKPKADEVALIERLSPMEDIALTKLKEGLESGDYQFVKLYMEYRFGKPKEKIEHSTDPDAPIIFKLDGRFKAD